MKKQYVNGYAKENKRKEKLVTAGLVALSILTLVVTVIIAGFLNEPAEDNTPAVATSEETVEVVETEEEVLQESEVQEIPQETEPEPKVNSVAEFCAPCEGTLLQEFSVHAPLYNETLDDWRVHMGVDISAPIGTKVKAIADGIISNKYEDLRHGYTVIIDHEGGFRSVYSNLAELETAVIGCRVAQGTVISSVGDTTLYETIADTHLHLELMKNEEHVNPLEYFNLVQ